MECGSTAYHGHPSLSKQFLFSPRSRFNATTANMTSSFVLQLLPTILTHPEVCKEEGYVMLQKLRYEDRQETVK